MAFSLRSTVSRWFEGALRWLTASVFRSTAIFVILTFVPILLLTYYIVASSIRTSKADALRADAELRDFSTTLLRTNFASERDALMGISDSTALTRLLAPGTVSDRLHTRRVKAANAELLRVLNRRPEFVWLALYDATGVRQAEAPQNAPASLLATHASWFDDVTAFSMPAISALQVSENNPPVLIFAVPIQEDHQFFGVLAGALPKSVVNDWVQRVNPGTDRFIYLLDANHRVVAAPAEGPIDAADIGTLPGVRQALHGHSGNNEFLTPTRLETNVITYAPLGEARQALLVVRPVRFAFYFLRVFYDKLALIAVIVFLLAVASGTLLRAAFRYYLRYNREVESGRSKTEALLGSIGDGVFAVDRDGRIIEFNRAAVSLTGERMEQALGLPYRQVFDLVDERTGALEVDPVLQVLEYGHTLRYQRDLVLVRRDGSRLPVTISAAPVLDDHGDVRGCVVVFTDASQEREVDRMKTEFISIASHQLRTPMTGVKGVLSLLLDEVLGPLNAEQRDYLRRAFEANERLIALVNDLLNVSRLEQGRVQIQWEPIHLDEMLRRLVGDFQSRAAHYRQLLTFEVEGDESTEIQGDPVRLREVFANLVDNAIKYTPEGGQVRVHVRPAGDDVFVDVIDSGVGIPPDKMASLFQKFSRIQNPLSAREFGSGLGLYFARSVVDLHHGAIDVSSEPEHGSTFTVRLPRHPVGARPPVSVPGAASSLTVPGRPGTVS
jgi:PAS domain S-box-containing protein